MDAVQRAERFGGDDGTHATVEDSPGVRRLTTRARATLRLGPRATRATATRLAASMRRPRV
jgi:hypothetical protein